MPITQTTQLSTIISDLKAAMMHQYNIQPKYESIEGFDGQAKAVLIERTVLKEDAFFANTIFIKASALEELTKNASGIKNIVFAQSFVLVKGEVKRVYLKEAQLLTIDEIYVSKDIPLNVIDENETHYKVILGLSAMPIHLSKEEVVLEQ